MLSETSDKNRLGSDQIIWQNFFEEDRDNTY